jgi:hypothetical protein
VEAHRTLNERKLGRLALHTGSPTMGLKTLQFLALLFTALGLAPSMAHLLEMPNKIKLPAEQYLTVQQIYRGWGLLGIVEILALLSTLALAIRMRKQARAFALSFFAFLCVASNLIVFFSFVYPIDFETNHWAELPDQWQALRMQWEYAHAVDAGLYLIALVALILSVLATDLARVRRRRYRP